ncbi:MAG TPA: tyrosine-type recombinase/integrase [Solirubrobacterales bacterium]|jgi:integrase|nr:tyrosine-type recombinase/integrase [Solirubrobacterales bacterium]
MSNRKAIRVEPGIFYKVSTAGKKLYEIRWRDSTGKYCRRSVGIKISEARAALTAELAKRGRNEPAPTNPRLSLGEAADGFLKNRVADLRESTRNGHRWAIEDYLRPRFGNRRFDRISADDWASFIRDLREGEDGEGLADSSIESVLKSARGIYSYALRRLDWQGRNTLALLDRSERPDVGGDPDAEHRMFTEAELAATLRAAAGQNVVVFATAGTVGSRISETLGLTDDNLDLADLDNAAISFTHQIDRKGKRVPLKTKASKRRIEIPRSLAVMLATHLLSAGDQRGLNGEPRFAFCTRTGRALSQRNVSRELRRAMKRAKLENGRLAFPILSATDGEGNPVKVERGVLPSFHSFRHLVASQVIADGDGAEEASWLLGHKDSTVTRRVYVAEIASAERTAKRRSKMEARMGSTLAALGTTNGGSAGGSATSDQDRPVPTTANGNVVALKPKAAASS